MTPAKYARRPPPPGDPDTEAVLGLLASDGLGGLSGSTMAILGEVGAEGDSIGSISLWNWSTRSPDRP